METKACPFPRNEKKTFTYKWVSMLTGWIQTVHIAQRASGNLWKEIECDTTLWDRLLVSGVIVHNFLVYWFTRNCFLPIFFSLSWILFFFLEIMCVSCRESDIVPSDEWYKWEWDGWRSLLFILIPSQSPQPFDGEYEEAQITSRN